MPVVRLISLRVHAVSDALVIVALLLVPWVWGFAGLNRPSLFVWAIAAVMLSAALTCDYPLGAVRVLPTKVHSLIEYVIAPSFFIMPFSQFSDVPGLPIVLLVLGAINLLTNASTDYPVAARSRNRN